MSGTRKSRARGTEKRSRHRCRKKSKQAKSISVDDLAALKLSEGVLESIGRVKLKLADVSIWGDDRSSVRFYPKGHETFVVIKMRIPTKKLLAFLGSITAFLIANNVVFQYFPAVSDFLVQRLRGP